MGLFDTFKRGLTKTREFLNRGISKIESLFSGDTDELIEDLEMLFIQADMGQESTGEILEVLRDDLESKRDFSEEHIKDVLRNEILNRLGEKKSFVPSKNSLQVIFLVGVNGTGKTTTAGKLSGFYKAQGRSVMLVAADTFRAAATEQLEVWAERAGVPCIKGGEGQDPSSLVFDGVQAASGKYDILIVDTAGRLHNKKNLMDELGKMRRIVSKADPSAAVESWLVIDATTGQNALVQAKAFNEIVKLGGMIVTKLDGNAKGGIAVALADMVKVPIYYAGLGEAAEDLVEFDPLAFANSLLPSESA